MFEQRREFKSPILRQLETAPDLLSSRLGAALISGHATGFAITSVGYDGRPRTAAASRSAAERCIVGVTWL